ncbi:hypothetical protein ACCT09_10560, partial [Rhizobium ruizarguesonis]
TKIHRKTAKQDLFLARNCHWVNHTEMSPSISCAACCVSYSTELEDGANSDPKAAFLTNAIS